MEVKVVPQESFLGRIMEQIVDAPVPQGAIEIVSATVDELTAAAPAAELAPDVELDDARQCIRLRRAFHAALAAQEPLQEEDAAPKSATASPIAKKAKKGKHKK